MRNGARKAYHCFEYLQVNKNQGKTRSSSSWLWKPWKPANSYGGPKIRVFRIIRVQTAICGKKPSLSVQKSKVCETLASSVLRPASTCRGFNNNDENSQHFHRCYSHSVEKEGKCK